MRVVHPTLGDLEVDPRGVIELPGGLLGFPQLRRFAVIELDEGNPFKWLQSLDDREVGFLIAEPTLFSPRYRVELRREEYAVLGLGPGEEAVVFVIVTVATSPRELTANLRGPVVVNLATRRGFQAVLTDPRYPLRAPLPSAWLGDVEGEEEGAAAPAGAAVEG